MGRIYACCGSHDDLPLEFVGASIRKKKKWRKARSIRRMKRFTIAWKARHLFHFVDDKAMVMSRVIWCVIIKQCACVIIIDDVHKVSCKFIYVSIRYALRISTCNKGYSGSEIRVVCKKKRTLCERSLGYPMACLNPIIFLIIESSSFKRFWQDVRC